MDYETRISKLEVQVDANHRDTDRLYQLIVEKFDGVERSINELRKQTEQSITDLRKENAQNIADLRKENAQSIADLRKETEQNIKQTNQRIDDLRAHNDQQFAELRREINVNLHWVVGLWMTTVGLIAGLAGRVLGMY